MQYLQLFDLQTVLVRQKIVTPTRILYFIVNYHSVIRLYAKSPLPTFYFFPFQYNNKYVIRINV